MATFHVMLKSKFLGAGVLAFFLLNILTPGSVLSQTSNELFQTSYSGPIPLGPTTASQTARLLVNSDNPAGDTIGTANSTVVVTASLSNQQYTGVNTGVGSPVVMFGASNTNGAFVPTPTQTLRTMNSIGAPFNSHYSDTVGGTAAGLNVAANSAFSMFTSLRQWAGTSSPAPNSRVYMADLTLTFSSPVTNPRLHIVGIGAIAATLGFATEFDLATPGLTFTKLQGNTALGVSATQINNGSGGAINASCGGNTAGCGTVRVNGSNITSITLQVYVRGDGGSAVWESVFDHTGDVWMLGVSVPESYSLSGTIFADLDGPTTINGAGTGLPGGTQLYATIADPIDFSVIGSIPVNSDGTYNFNGLPGGAVNYDVDISTLQGTVFSPSPSRVLPFGWSNVGENVGAGPGNDGTANGQLTTGVGTADVANGNFGISLAPSAASVEISGRVYFADGRPANRVSLTIVNAATQETHHASTNAFGYFRFEGIEVGNFYILTATHMRSGATTSQHFQLFDTVSDLALQLNPAEGIKKTHSHD